MSLVIDNFLCKACSNKNCSEHVAEKIATDPITGLAVKIVCACPNHLRK